MSEDDFFEAPTRPTNLVPCMTMPQIRAALEAFPVDQQALIQAMLYGASDDGFLRGAGGLPRLNPFAPPPDQSLDRGKKRKKR